MALNVELRGQGVKDGKLHPASIGAIIVGLVLLAVWLVR